MKGNIQEVHDLILKGADKNAPLDKELKTPFPALENLDFLVHQKKTGCLETQGLDSPKTKQKNTALMIFLEGLCLDLDRNLEKSWENARR